MLNQILVGIAVMLVVAANDLFWTKYVTAANQQKAMKASIYSVLIVLSSGFTVTQYVENKWFIIPAAIGAFIGTYLPVMHEKKLQDK